MILKHYDYLIVGSGLYGAVFAYLAKQNNKSVCVIERRDHIGGNIFCGYKNGITVHKYGAHIFHTDKSWIWNFINSFTTFHNYINSPIANNNGKLYNLPFNMNTFYQIYGVTDPVKAEQCINNARPNISEPKNLEEQALNLVGSDIYRLLIKDYTEKQWGRSCTELPPEIIKRIPLRFTFDNNYFDNNYQGIPTSNFGYTELIKKLLENIEVYTNTSYSSLYHDIADKIIYTGSIDEYFNYRLGYLEYRSVNFIEKLYNCDNVQGVAVVNYTSHKEPFTRTIEHKHFNKYQSSKVSIVSTEYPIEWKPGIEPYYPINDLKNTKLYNEYLEYAKKIDNKVFFGGRLGKYKYFDMDKTIEESFKDFEEINV